MNDLITLEQAKDQLRVLHSYEDSKIKSLIKAAISAVFNHLDRPADGTDPRPFLIDPDTKLAVQPYKLQPDIETAVLMIVDDLYNNRGAKRSNALVENEAINFLLRSYRRIGV